MFTLGLLSAAIGAFNSFVFHLFLCMSPRIKAVLAYLDYMGIFCIGTCDAAAPRALARLAQVADPWCSIGHQLGDGALGVSVLPADSLRVDRRVRHLLCGDGARGVLGSCAPQSATAYLVRW